VKKLDAGALAPSSPDYWAARAAVDYRGTDGQYDRGILSIYFLNLMRLDPGQGAFIRPGVLHAHLSGTAVEIMASSDNVLRGGLTPKHVDVPELLRVVRFNPTRPCAMSGHDVSPAERAYPTPAQEFALSRLALSLGASQARHPEAGPDALLVIDGRVIVRTGKGGLLLERGQSAFVPAGLGYALEGETDAVVFCASVPEAAPPVRPD
jgi:mannose-6-phosphate isomerase